MKKWVLFWFSGLLLATALAMWIGSFGFLILPFCAIVSVIGYFTKGRLGLAMAFGALAYLLTALIVFLVVWPPAMIILGAAFLIVLLFMLRSWRRKRRTKAREEGGPPPVRKERQWVAVITEYFFPILLLTFLSLVAKVGGFPQFFGAFSGANHSVLQALGKSIAVVFVGWVIAWSIVHRFTLEKGKYRWIWLSVCVLGIFLIKSSPFIPAFGTPGSDEMQVCLEGGPIPGYTLPTSASKFYGGPIPVQKAGDVKEGYNLLFGQWIAVKVEGRLEDKYISKRTRRLKGVSVAGVSWDAEAALYPSDFGPQFRENIPCPRQVFGGPIITLQHKSGVRLRWEPANGHQVKFALYKVRFPEATLVTGINLPRSTGMLALIQKHTGTENGGAIGQYDAFWGPGTKSGYRITIWLVPPPTAEQLMAIEEYAKKLAYL